MEEIIIPVIIVSIIQIVLIILFVQATVNIKKIYGLLYNKFENDTQEKIEAKKKEIQTGQNNQNSEPKSKDQSSDQHYSITNDATSVLLIGVAIIVIIIILIASL